MEILKSFCLTSDSRAAVTDSAAWGWSIPRSDTLYFERQFVFCSWQRLVSNPDPIITREQTPGIIRMARTCFNWTVNVINVNQYITRFHPEKLGPWPCLPEVRKLHEQFIQQTVSGFVKVPRSNAAKQQRMSNNFQAKEYCAEILALALTERMYLCSSQHCPAGRLCQFLHGATLKLITTATL